MIALYPMLVSNTVSKNIIPGISKVLENFLIVYGMKNIMEKARGEKATRGLSNYSFKKRLTIKESDDPIADYFYREAMFEQSQINQQTGQGTKGKQVQSQSGQAQAQRAKATGGKAVAAASVGDINVTVQPEEKDKAKDARVDIGAFEMKSISLEPTWMKTDIVTKDGIKTSGIVGVKVVPYPVKSDAKLSQLLMYDRQVNNLQGLVIRRGRWVENFFYKAWKIMWKIGTIGVGVGPAGGMGVTGNPKHDILARRTILKARDASDIFVLVNQADLTDDFYTSANGILNLFRMGWSSIIIADDVNKRVSFCMRELKGMCSMMPYTMLYQSYQQAKVYEDLEDAKRTASSIFKVQRKKFSKIVGESIAQSKIEDFGMQNMPLLESELISEIEYVDENMGAFVKSLTPAKIKSTILNMLKGNTKGLPKVEPDKLLKIASKGHPEFRKSYLLAKKVLANSSPEIKNNKVVELAAIGVASRAIIESSKDVGKDIIVSTKEGLKRFIKNYRKNRDGLSKSTTMPIEHYAEATFGWIAVLGALSVAVFAYSKLLMPLIKQIPGFLSHLITDTLPYLKQTINDFFSGSGVSDTAAAIKNWDVTTAAPAELGLFVVVAVVAGSALLGILFPRGR
ncbi:MAG: hypothetical protein ACTSVB_08710 [Candidatus Heimdallarchaeaceae archaeon]